MAAVKVVGMVVVLVKLVVALLIFCWILFYILLLDSDTRLFFWLMFSFPKYFLEMLVLIVLKLLCSEEVSF